MKYRNLIAMLVLLLCGGGLGFAAGQHYAGLRMRGLMARGPQGMVEFTRQRLDEELTLTPAQSAAATDILKVAADDIEAMRREHRTQFHERMEAALQALRPHLEPAQQGKLDALTVDDLRPHFLPRPPEEKAHPAEASH